MPPIRTPAWRWRWLPRRSTPAAPPGSRLRRDAGLVYLTEAYAPQAEGLLAELQQRWPGVHWVGSVAWA